MNGDNLGIRLEEGMDKDESGRIKKTN